MKIPIAADFMHRDVACARPDQTLDELASFLTEEDVHGAPVVADDGALVGIVSRSDVVRAMAEAKADEQPQAATREGGESGMADSGEDADIAPTPAPESVITAREIMSTQVVTASPGATPGQIADLMHTNKIQRVVVMDSGKVVGLVSISDLLPLIAGYEKSLQRTNTPGTSTPARTAVPRKAVKAAKKAPAKASSAKSKAKAAAAAKGPSKRRGASAGRKSAGARKAKVAGGRRRK